MSDTIQSTPLCEKHVELGGKMVPFAGWNMPVQYSGIMDEHKAVREACGVFDISHMGQFIVSGQGATAWLNYMLTNNVEKLSLNQGQYSLMLNYSGGVIDDLILYRDGEERFFVVVNASMIEEDYAWLEGKKPEGIVLENHSSDYVGLAVQGPSCQEVFAKVLPGAELPPRNGIAHVTVNGENCVICRTGYTGEDGYEFFCPAASGVAWFEKFLAAGAKPCGLGARDSLRLEMCYPLNGSDLAPDRTPIEAGLGFFCDLSKDFIGADVLRKQKEEGPAVRLAAIEYTAKGAPPRHGYAVQLPDGTTIGELCSGVLSPSLGKGVGMAYLPAEYAKIGTELQIEVRGKKTPAVVVKKPFYKKEK